MILEHALIDVTPGSEDAFLAAFSEARQVLAASPGFVSAQMHRGIEHPSRFLLLVRWSDLDAHLVGFRQSDAFTRWRSLIGPFFAGGPAVDHYDEEKLST
jgi:heme-degrading monooxygenase HmoA